MARRRNGRGLAGGIIDTRYTLLGFGSGVYTDAAAYGDGEAISGGGEIITPEDLVTNGDGVGPPIPYQPPPPGTLRGHIYWQRVDTPAAQTDFTYTHDEDFRVTVLNVFFLLVTSAVAGNRTGSIAIVDDNQQPLAMHYTNLSQAASIRSYWQFNPNFPSNAGSGHTISIAGTIYGIRQNFIPEVILQPYQTLRTGFNWQAAGMQAGDQISDAVVLLRREI